MVPPTSLDESKGKRLDGLSRSAQWRDVDAERKAAEACKAAEANGQPGHPATNSRYSPPTELRRSLMIPADQLPLDSENSEEPIETHSNGGSRDTYMESLIAQSVGPETETSIEPTDVDDGQTATDRFFEQQAISPPRPVARQTAGKGTAGLTITETPARRRRRLRIRPPRSPLRGTSIRARENQPSPSARRSAIFAGRRRLALACATTLAVIAASAIIVSRSPSAPHAHHQLNVALGSPPATASSLYPASLAAVVNREISRLADHRFTTRRHRRPRPHRPTHRRHPYPVRARRSSPAPQAPRVAPSNSGAGAGAGAGGASTSSTVAATSHSSVASSDSNAATSATPSASSSQPTSTPSGASQSQPAGPTGAAAILGPGHCNC